MKCSLCGCEARLVASAGRGDAVDGYSMKHGVSSGVGNLNHGHPIIGLAQLAYQAYKAVSLSTQDKYRCTSCGWTFRR